MYHLDEDQTKAVSAAEGPVLVLAGAGSGKTRVLTHRIAFLINQMGYEPREICALTFTNKAAKEMRERIIGILQSSGKSIHAEDLDVTTFHSMAFRLMKRHATELGFSSNLTIYDAQDQQRLVRDVGREMGLDDTQADYRGLVGYFARLKERIFDREVEPNEIKHFELYQAYQKRLKASNAIDFADMLRGWHALLVKRKPVWRYILVDEFQDTNALQLAILKRLCVDHQNIFVVGDEDQSIYKFRGAVIENIINFDALFPKVEIIRLRHNYRSSQQIVDAASHVINHNGRRVAEKQMIALNKGGDLIEVVKVPSDIDEAQSVVSSIRRAQSQGASENEMAIFYRTHSQSRVVEDALRSANLPYRVYGGLRFYDRAEIKNVLAYFKLAVNPIDEVALKRIINVPARGIGKLSLERCVHHASQLGCPLFEVLKDHLVSVGLSARAQAAIQKFIAMVSQWQQPFNGSLSERVHRIILDSGYEIALAGAETPETQIRLDNISELRNAVSEFEHQVPDGSLSDFLDSLHLTQENVSKQETGDTISLMTCHAAKGLEFDWVFLLGCEEGIFPLSNPTSDQIEDTEEERRLFYVAMTRARKHLCLTSAYRRRRHGFYQCNAPSRFLFEIPESYTKVTDVMAEDILSASRESSSDYHYEYEDQSVTGQWVTHPVFGEGKIIGVEDNNQRYKIRFKKVGVKRISASFASHMQMD